MKIACKTRRRRLQIVGSTQFVAAIKKKIKVRRGSDATHGKERKRIVKRSGPTYPTQNEEEQEVVNKDLKRMARVCQV